MMDHFKEIDDDTPDAIFKQFVDECSEAVAFAALVDDGERIRVASAYRRDQAIRLAYRLRRMARQIEADYESVPDL